MTKERWQHLMANPVHESWCCLNNVENTGNCDCGGWDERRLTASEQERGWHFCLDWDGLLVGPGMEEGQSCTCSYTSG